MSEQNNGDKNKKNEKDKKNDLILRNNDAQLTNKERAKKDLAMLAERLNYFKSLNLDKKYAISFDWAERYYRDADYYYKKKDYFTSFGCANYAYGILDGILLAEGKHK